MKPSRAQTNPQFPARSSPQSTDLLLAQIGNISFTNTSPKIVFTSSTTEIDTWLPTCLKRKERFVKLQLYSPHSFTFFCRLGSYSRYREGLEKARCIFTFEFFRCLGKTNYTMASFCCSLHNFKLLEHDIGLVWCQRLYSVSWSSNAVANVRS